MICECGHGVGVHAPACLCGCQGFNSAEPLTPERLAEALWDYRESCDPSGELMDGQPAGTSYREPVFWKQAEAENLWPSSRAETLREASVVLEMLGLRKSSAA